MPIHGKMNKLCHIHSVESSIDLNTLTWYIEQEGHRNFMNDTHLLKETVSEAKIENALECTES